MIKANTTFEKYLRSPFFRKYSDNFHPELFNTFSTIEQNIINRNQLYKFKRREIIIKSLKGESIRVVFLIIFSSIWKYDQLYKLLLEDKRFDPLIIICPIKDNSLRVQEEIEKNIAFFTKKGYRFINAQNDKSGNLIDIEKEIKPDIVFFSNPYKGVIIDQYYITEFKNSLTAYIPYSFYATKHFLNLAEDPFYNLIWKNYCETEFHFNELVQNTTIKNMNLVVTGYPGCDNIVIKDIDQNIWKNTNPIKIIWAPHWLPLEIFIRDAEFMLKLASMYESKIQIALRPHPFIKNALIKNGIWDNEKIESYFAQWKNNVNTLLLEDEYSEYFWSSTAMIHNSGSFMSEYLVTGHPCLFVSDNFEHMCYKSKYTESIIEWNDYGKNALSVHYHASNQKEIINFIENIIIENNDYMQHMRNEFIETKIHNSKIYTPSINIYKDLIKSLMLENVFITFLKHLVNIKLF